MTFKSTQIERHESADDFSMVKILLTIVEFYSFFLRNLRFLITGLFLGCVVGLGYSYLQKPVFTARTTFVLQEGDGGSGIGQYAGMAAMVGIDIGGGGGGIFQGDNIIQLYKSRSMIQRALLSSAKFDSKEQLLIDRYLDFTGIRKRWKKPELNQISFADSSKFGVLQDSILGEVIKIIKEKSLIVDKIDKKLSILKVEVSTTDQQFSKNFNERIVSTVNNFYVVTKTGKSLQNINILQHQTDSVRTVLNGAVYTASATLDATPNLNPSKQVLRAPVQKAQFNAEANKAILSELVKHLELAKISYRKEVPLIQIVDMPIYPLDKLKVGVWKSVLIGGMSGLALVLIFIYLSKTIKVVFNTVHKKKLIKN